MPRMAHLFCLVTRKMALILRQKRWGTVSAKEARTCYSLSCLLATATEVTNDTFLLVICQRLYIIYKGKSKHLSSVRLQSYIYIIWVWLTTTSYLSHHIPAMLSCCFSLNMISSFPSFSQVPCTCCSPYKDLHSCLIIHSLTSFLFLCKYHFLGKNFADHPKTTISYHYPLNEFYFSS